jgi:5-formyltetrahydrofolate cyclo-ligase
LRDAKRALRDRVLAARNGLPAATHRASSLAIAASLAARDDFRAAHTVLLTLSFRGEWDTSALIAAALGAGKTLVLPRVNQASRMLELCAVVDVDRETVGGFRGIREPDVSCATVAPGAVEWVLVPGVAFDRECRRLGYGGGYYDRLLPSIAASVPRIAGAFELQVVDHVPASHHDLGVDAVVTEERTLAPSR